MKRRDWWAGVMLICAALLVFRAFPRYEWRGAATALVRIDRWTGHAEAGTTSRVLTGSGRWMSFTEIDAARHQGLARQWPAALVSALVLPLVGFLAFIAWRGRLWRRNPSAAASVATTTKISAFDFTCRRCAEVFHTEPQHAGRMIRCPRCGEINECPPASAMPLSKILGELPHDDRPRFSTGVFLAAGAALVTVVLVASILFVRLHLGGGRASSGENLTLPTSSAPSAAQRSESADSSQRAPEQQASDAVRGSTEAGSEAENPAAPPGPARKRVPARRVAPSVPVNGWQAHDVASAAAAPVPSNDALTEVDRLIGRDRRTGVSLAGVGVRAVTGTELCAHDTPASNLGTLSVENGTAYDAVVALFRVDAPSGGDAVRCFYVRASETAKSSRIVPGEYELRFSLGTYWDNDARQFMEPVSFQRFTEPLRYTEMLRGSGTEFVAHEITLQPVLNGNAQVEAIDPQLFKLPRLPR